MNRGMRHGLGWALIGVLLWGVAVWLSWQLPDDAPALLALLVGLVALAGVVLVVGALALTAWRLIRS